MPDQLTGERATTPQTRAGIIDTRKAGPRAVRYADKNGIAIFEGDIVLDGTLHVGPEGRIDANITARAIVVGGIVRGNLSADTRVEILPTGALTGSVKSSSFSAADGASVKGELWLDRPESPSHASEGRG